MKKIEVNKKKRVVVCILQDECAKGVGIARCHPNDTFDVNKGTKIAIKRAKAKINKERIKLLQKKINVELNIVAGLKIKQNKLIKYGYLLEDEISKLK